jgi:hypothetical protein
MIKTGKLLMPAFLLFFSLLLFGKRTFEDAQSSPLALENLNKLVGLAGSLVLSWVFFVRQRKLILPPCVGWFALYTSVCLLSSLFYSQWVVYSVWKTAELVAALCVTIYISALARRRPEIAYAYYEACLKFFGLIVVAALIGLLIDPSGALTPPVSDKAIETFGEPVVPYQLYSNAIIVVNPNSLGAMGAILTYVYGVRWLGGERGLKAGCWLLACLVVFLLAQSRTAWIGFSVALTWYVLFSKSLTRRQRCLLGFGVLAVVVAGSGFFAAYWTRNQGVEQLQGMSGRALWWLIAWSRFQESSFDEQLVGLGFMTANRTIVSEAIGYSVSSLHSDYADALISSGYLGLGFLIAFILSGFFRLFALRKARTGLVAELIGVCLILFVRSFTGPTFATFGFYQLLFLAIVVVCGVMRRSESELKRKSQQIAGVERALRPNLTTEQVRNSGGTTRFSRKSA